MSSQVADVNKVKAQMFMQVWYFSLHYYLMTRFFNCIVKQKLLPVLLYCCYSFQCSFQIHTEAHNASAFYLYHLCYVSFILLGNIIVFLFRTFVMIFTFFLCFSYHCFILPSMFFLFCWRFGWKIAENVQGIKIKKNLRFYRGCLYIFLSLSLLKQWKMNVARKSRIQ